MLELITKSKIRQKIILLFIYNQNREYYLSEIARAVGTSAGTAQREINRLLQNDLITFKKKAGINIYALNKSFPLLCEVESIIRKTIGIEVELRKVMEKMRGVCFAFLFGSYAQSGFKSDSDIDLFIIGTTDENKVFRATQKAGKIIGREINYHLADKKDFLEKLRRVSFYKEITKNYILLIGNKNEFRKIVGTAH